MDYNKNVKNISFALKFLICIICLLIIVVFFISELPQEYQLKVARKIDSFYSIILKPRHILYKKITNTKDFLGSTLENLASKLSFLEKTNDTEQIVPKTSEIKGGVLPKIEESKKWIDINLRTQRLALWENDKQLVEFAISSGKPSTPTKSGNFTVISKYPMAIGVIKGQVWSMPYFVGIYQAGSTENGIHELPFLNGYRESSSSIGYPISHGCVRLRIGEAEKVYNFSKIDTPVYVHY